MNESLLAELSTEVEELVERKPPPTDKVGFHHYFERPKDLPHARRVLDSCVLDIASELVVSHSIDLSFPHIQIATIIYGWDHQPGGGHIDGYGISGQTEPASFTMLAGARNATLLWSRRVHRSTRHPCRLYGGEVLPDKIIMYRRPAKARNR